MVLIYGAISHVITLWVLRMSTRRFARHDERHSGGLLRNEDAILAHANDLIQEFDIRTPSAQIDGGNLSGGNQQKMIVAREFSRKPALLIASQPTRGIDVGSIEFIHRRIIDQRDEGAAVLLVSAELDEIMALSDRIAVMYKGEIIDTLDAKDATREQLGLLMAGIRPNGISNLRIRIN
jgi:simple sugar transport system ATP-binding protein